MSLYKDSYLYFNDPDWGLGHFRLQTWLPFTIKVSDLHRRSEISQKANERYYESLAACESEMTVKECVESVCEEPG